MESQTAEEEQQAPQTTHVAAPDPSPRQNPAKPQNQPHTVTPAELPHDPGHAATTEPRGDVREKESDARDQEPHPHTPGEPREGNPTEKDPRDSEAKNRDPRDTEVRDSEARDKDAREWEAREPLRSQLRMERDPGPVVLDKQLLSKLNKTLKEKQRMAKNPTTIQDLPTVTPEASVSDAEITAESSDREEPRRRKRVAKQTSTRTDFFAAKLASAVDDVELSDSDETFVYETNAQPAATPQALDEPDNINQAPHLVQLVNDNISVAGSVTPLEGPVSGHAAASVPAGPHAQTTANALLSSLATMGPPPMAESAAAEDDARESVHLVQLSKWNLRNTFGVNTTPPTASRLQYAAEFSNPYAADRVARRKSSVHLLFTDDKAHKLEMAHAVLAHPGLAHNLSQPLLYPGSYLFDVDGLSDGLIHSDEERGSSESHRSAAPSGSVSASVSVNGAAQAGVNGVLNGVTVGNLGALNGGGPGGPGGLDSGLTNAGISGAVTASNGPVSTDAVSFGPAGPVGAPGHSNSGMNSSILPGASASSTTPTPNATVDRKSKTPSSKLRSTTSKLFDKTGTQPRRYSTIPDDFDIEDFDDELIYYDNNNIRFPYYSQNNSMNDSTLLLANAKIPHYRSMNFPGRRAASNGKAKRYMSAGYVPNGFGKNKKGDIFPFAGQDPSNFYYDIDEYDEQGEGPTDKPLMPSRSHLGSSPRFMLPRKVSNGSLSGGRFSCFRSFLVTFISFLFILSVGFFLGFLLASTKDLSNISIVGIENALVSQDELVFSVVVEALNPGWFTVSVTDIDIDIFAKSGYLGHPASDFAVETVLLGSVYNFESALTFKGGFFSRDVLQETGEIKLVGPGKNLTGLAIKDNDASANKNRGDADQPDNSEKWDTISKHPFDLILRGVLKYNLPLTSTVKTAVINKVSYIDPSLANVE